MEKYLNFDFEKQSDRLKFFIYCFIGTLAVILLGNIIYLILSIAGVCFIVFGFILLFVGCLPSLYFLCGGYEEDGDDEDDENLTKK